MNLNQREAIGVLWHRLPTTAREGQSQAHSLLFEKVDEISQKLMLDCNPKIL